MPRERAWPLLLLLFSFGLECAMYDGKGAADWSIKMTMRGESQGITCAAAHLPRSSLPCRMSWHRVGFLEPEARCVPRVVSCRVVMIDEGATCVDGLRASYRRRSIVLP